LEYWALNNEPVAPGAITTSAECIVLEFRHPLRQHTAEFGKFVLARGETKDYVAEFYDGAHISECSDEITDYYLYFENSSNITEISRQLVLSVKRIVEPSLGVDNEALAVNTLPTPAPTPSDVNFNLLHYTGQKRYKSVSTPSGRGCKLDSDTIRMTTTVFSVSLSEIANLESSYNCSASLINKEYFCDYTQGGIQVKCSSRVGCEAYSFFLGRYVSGGTFHNIYCD
jgi:hypothetical protein